jgi:hypothetical protein
MEQGTQKLQGHAPRRVLEIVSELLDPPTTCVTLAELHMRQHVSQQPVLSSLNINNKQPVSCCSTPELESVSCLSSLAGGDVSASCCTGEW